jgi:plastocyanin
MQNDFRERVFLPLMIPVAVVLGFVGFAFFLSRVLLTVPEWLAVVIAIAVASYVLVIASYVSSQPRISSRALGVGLVLGLVGVVAAGAVAAAAGMRPLEEHGEEAVAGAEAGEEGEAAAAEVPEDAQVFVAVDIDWAEAPQTVPAGEVQVALVNEGGIVHNVIIEELGDQLVAEAQGGETATGSVTLDPGEYTYYCGVPGHRPAGMEGTLTAS